MLYPNGVTGDNQSTETDKTYQSPPGLNCAKSSDHGNIRGEDVSTNSLTSTFTLLAGQFRQAPLLLKHDPVDRRAAQEMLDMGEDIFPSLPIYDAVAAALHHHQLLEGAGYLLK